MTALDGFDGKLRALRSHGFAIAQPVAESEVCRVEEESGVSLPLEYREFLLRFGDGQVGPGHFNRLREGLTPASRRPFPLAAPILGRCSPTHQCLPKDAQWQEYRRLLRAWEVIPKDNGVLSMCDYGCAIYGRLVLNGPFCGKVWVLAGDAAYYGPFGGSELLHDESALDEWDPKAAPRDYSFFEWYESWLDAQLNMSK